MYKFPWDDDAISECAHKTATDVPRSLSVIELAAFGLPVDDPFWMSPEAFEAHLAEIEGQGGEQTKKLGPDAPAAQNIRVASPSRTPLPSLDPRKKGPAMNEQIPEPVLRAVCIIAKPRAPEDQIIGAAYHLLKWYTSEYESNPEISEMVLWWWKVARRHVDIRKAWVDDMRALWKTSERPHALDPASASVNAFYGHLAQHAARAFITAKGFKPNDDVGRAFLRGAGLPSSESRQIHQLGHQHQRPTR
ncbi:hypothetical protein [Phaeobacter inhibens]|uniref:hypothetical protein n=1 Tax=Phaeobacter inhibens TaxID=221822 RepID=UPI000C998067|nr:hypothetical protein [Phaeobacter inhibens]AUQ81147.1 hypothetical protein PhaeoP57_00181 [Phaeobacter inhibens]